MSFPRSSRVLSLFLLIILATAEKHDNSTAAEWGRMTGNFLQECWSSSTTPDEQEELFPILQTCFQQKSLSLFTEIIQSDSVEVLDGVQLIKIRNKKSSRKMEYKDAPDWETQVRDKVGELFETHVLQIHLEDLVEQDPNVNEARRRRRGNGMMQFLMFGLLAKAMLLVPMGFKFLTILGAKALLLAKMALMLSSIQGLKKMATSGISYGLYHTPPSDPWYYDRQGLGLADVPDEQLHFLHHKHGRS